MDNTQTAYQGSATGEAQQKRNRGRFSVALRVVVMDKAEALRMNATALAWIGDAVYEIYVRKHVLESGARQADKLHTAGVRYVKASAQAAVMKELWKEDSEVLGDDERSLVRRARNKKNATRPKNADPMDYKWATALEALIGYLYMTEQKIKLEYVVSLALDMIESDKC